MKKISETIVFFGSGPVAAKALELLHEHAFIEAVITKPQPKHHKETFPVLAVSKKLGLKTFTASNKADLSQLFAKKIFKSPLGVVIDYGVIIPKEVIDYFPLGIINSHFSLLPKWRGADPITFAILSGDTETGVSLMLIVERLDEGPLLAQDNLTIQPDMTTPHLTEQLIAMSDSLLKETLLPYFGGQIGSWPQDTSIAPTYSRRLNKDDGLIDWQKPAEQIEREIRAYLEWPKSRFRLIGKDIIVTKAHVAEYDMHPAEKAKAFITPDNLIGIQTGQGILVIDRLKPAGKREMSAKEFIAGYDRLL